MNWVADYIGRPWRAYASGPDAFDCHGLVWHCLATHFGIDVSRYRDVISGDAAAMTTAIEGEQATGDWVKVSHPQPGCVVLIGRGRRWHHIGLWVGVNGGRCLHAHHDYGVALDALDRLHELGKIEFWLHRRLL